VRHLLFTILFPSDLQDPMASNNRKGKGKKRGVSTDTSAANKWARVDGNAAGLVLPGNSGGTASGQPSCRATVATEEEDAASHGDDVVREDVIDSSTDESEAESSEAELGKTISIF
jgi:hypothetical protein